MENGRRGVVLVVDDDGLIRETVGEILQATGVPYLLADSGETAIEALEGRRDEIGLAIIDMIMDGMNGPETFRRLRAISPDLKTILASGYPQDGEVDELLAEGASAFLGKPFNILDLSRLIDSLMGESSSSSCD